MKEVILRRLAAIINHCFAKIILLGGHVRSTFDYSPREARLDYFH